MWLCNTVSKILVVKIKYSIFCPPLRLCLEISVAESHHFYAAPAQVENFDAALALAAPASTKGLQFCMFFWFRETRN
jgi:hypothetical protein